MTATDEWLQWVLERIEMIPPDRDHTSVPVADLRLLHDEVRRLNAILELKRASEERLLAALAESERTSETLSKYLNYLSEENSRLRGQVNGTADE